MNIMRRVYDIFSIVNKALRTFNGFRQWTDLSGSPVIIKFRANQIEPGGFCQGEMSVSSPGA